MRMTGPGQRLTIYLGESDQWQGRPLGMALIEALKGAGLAGATMTRALAGYGAHARIRSAAVEVLSFDLPLIVEVVDQPEKIEAALRVAAPMVREGLITVEEVTIVKYGHRLMHPLPGDRPVREVMTREVTSVRPDTPLADVMDVLLRRLLKAAPVVDGAGRVVGIISDGDLLERGGAGARLAVAEHLEEAEVRALLDEMRRSGLTAADVMTRDPATAGEEEALAHAVQAMAERNLKRLPVVDARGRLQGMLSRVDVLRTVAEAPAAPDRAALPAGGGHTVGEVMVRDVPQVPEDAGLPEIVDALVGAQVKRVLVVDAAGRAVGVITDGDLVARVRPEERPGLLRALRRRARAPSPRRGLRQAGATARDLMSPEVFKGPPETPIAEAVRQMLAAKRKRFYVVDEAGRPLGAVDRQTLLLAVAGRQRM